MATWLEAIAAELEEITETQEGFAEPEVPTSPGEHVVGIANRDLRKIFFLCCRYRKRALESIAASFEANKEERKKQYKQYQTFYRQAEVLKEIFWVSCRATYPELWDKLAIGIKKDWKLVWAGSDRDPLEILDEMLGNDGELDDILRGGSSGSFGSTPRKSRPN